MSTCIHTHVHMPTCPPYPHALTHTNTSARTHAHMPTCTLAHAYSHGHLHAHRLSEHQDAPIILVKGFNYATPTPVINPPPSPEEVSGPASQGRRQGREAKMSTSGREDVGTGAAQHGFWANRSRRIKENQGWGQREGGGQKALEPPRESGRYSCSTWTGQMAIGQQLAVGGRQEGERTFPVCFTKARRFRQEGR